MHYIHIPNRETVEIRPVEIRFPKTHGLMRFLRADTDHHDTEAEVRATRDFREKLARLISPASTAETPITITYRDLIELMSDEYGYFACPDCGEAIDTVDYSCYERVYGRAEMAYGEPDNHETSDHGDSDDYTYNCPHCGDEIDPYGLPCNIDMPLWMEFHRFLSNLFTADEPHVAGQPVTFVNDAPRPARQRPTLAQDDTNEGMPISTLAEEAEDLISQP